MRLICLCSGNGTRLRPLSDKVHKTMVPIYGTPNLIRSISLLVNSKVLFNKVTIVCQDDFIDKYKSKIISSLKDYNVEVEFVVNDDSREGNWKTMLLGISGKDKDEPFVSIEGDIVISPDFCKILEECEIDENYYFCNYRKGEWTILTSPNSTAVLSRDCNGMSMSGVTLISHGLKSLYNELLKSENDEFWDKRLLLSDAGCKIIPVNSRNTLTEYDSIHDLISKGLLSSQDIACLLSDDNRYEKVGGMTNDNFLIKYKGKKVVLRLPGSGTDSFIVRGREKYSYLFVKDKKIVPNTEFYRDGIKLTDYIEDARTSSYDDYPSVLNLLSKFHSSHCLDDFVEVSEGIVTDLIEELTTYESLYDRSRVPEEYDEVSRWYSDFIINNQNKNVVLCHRDLDPRNILISKDKVYIIDLEYSGLLNYYWDLGCQVSECKLHFGRNLLEEDHYYEALQDYSNQTGFEICLEDIEVWSGVVDFIWACWTIAKESLGEDFGDYFNRRWKEACKIKEKYTTK